MENKELLNKISNTGLALFAVGMAALGLYAFSSNKIPWDIVLTNFVFLVRFTQGALVIAILLRMASAKWGHVFYRLAFTIGLAFFPIALVMLGISFFSMDAIFFWVEEAGNKVWYNPAFYVLRDSLSFILFYGLAWMLFKSTLNGSKSDDSVSHDDSLVKTINFNQLQKGFFVVAAFMIHQTLISYDFGMTLNHEFSETVYAPFFISKSLFAGTAFITLAMIFFRKYLGVKVFKLYHFENIGQLLLGLTVVQFYMWWSQFFPIWYGNMPEETNALYLRIFSSYKPIFALMMILTFVIPFLGLIFKKVRTTTGGLAAVSSAIILGTWFDSYLTIAPALVEHHKVVKSFVLNPVNIFFTAGIIGLFLFVLIMMLKNNPQVIPSSDEEIDNDLVIAKATGW